MRVVLLRFVLLATIVGTLVWFMPTTVTGQTPVPGTPVWSPSRTPDGQPDFRGVWRVGDVGEPDDIELGVDPQHAQIQGRAPRPALVIVDPVDKKIPYTPQAMAIKQERYADRRSTNPLVRDPLLRCFLAGVPRINYTNNTFQVHQSAGYVLLIHEFQHAYRIVPLDNRPRLGENVKLWMGDSRGRWEGNTLVIDVTNYNDKTWFDQVGAFHSDTLHVVERWMMVDADTINYEATLEDPKAYTRPWKMGFKFLRNKQPDWEPQEDACYEGHHMAEQFRAR